MSWAEFVLRSIGFKENREFEMRMYREVAYQSYCTQFIFAKGRPTNKLKWWKIGDEKQRKGPTESQATAMKAAQERYQLELSELAKNKKDD